ncbi:hypothetical protein GCM10010336_19460 [Streptomyces goshikiensis]|nr:hypothetical protein GCM10010336_19460 [Streptomyces goshikiensis]
MYGFDTPGSKPVCAGLTYREEGVTAGSGPRSVGLWPLLPYYARSTTRDLLWAEELCR